MRKWKSLTLSLGGVELRGNRPKEARYKVCHRCGLLAGILHIAITLGNAILIVFFLEWVATSAWLKVPTNCVGEWGKSQLWQLMVSRYKLSTLHEVFLFNEYLQSDSKNWGLELTPGFVNSSSSTKKDTTYCFTSLVLNMQGCSAFFIVI